MTARRSAAIAMLSLLLISCGAQSPTNETTTKQSVRAILVHGAFADGSAWREVAPLLEAGGIEVATPTLPLNSLADDVAMVQAAIDRETGNVILVGHSWAGAVITQAGMDDQVVGLVYLAAIAPEPGQTTNDLLSRFPPAPAGSRITPNANGGLQISTEGMCQDIAQNLSAGECEQMAREQRPIAAASFDEAVSVASWKSRPAWYMVATNDRAMPPALQREMAETIGAETTTVETGHSVMLAAPGVVADFIAKAAEAVQRQ